MFLPEVSMLAFRFSRGTLQLATKFWQLRRGVLLQWSDIAWCKYRAPQFCSSVSLKGEPIEATFFLAAF